MWIVRRVLAVLWCVLASLAAGPAQAEKRLALSVGIDVYDNLPAHEQLRKAVNDARAVGAALGELGFETTVEENLTRLAFISAWQKFLNRLQPGDTAALFFAGHGVVLDGANYLVPRDVPKIGPKEYKVLAAASIRFNELMEHLREKNVRVALFIVDACRDNPFRDARGRFIVGGKRGLRRVEEEVKGSFILYSAGYGEQALDRLSDADKEPTSPYTRTLLPILKTPGLSLPEIAVRVRREVVELARKAHPPHEQTPAYYDQLVGDFVLKAGAKPTALPPPSDAELWKEAERTWAAVKDSTSIAELEVILKRYARPPASVFADLAKARIEELKKKQPLTPKAEPAVSVSSASRTPAPLTAAEERALKPGDIFRECDVCPEMVVVPAGSFMMGEEGRSSHPQRKVTIARPFAVAKFEATFAEWDACVAAAGCRHNPEASDRGKRPVFWVSWNDVTSEYLPWITAGPGRPIGC